MGRWSEFPLGVRVCIWVVRPLLAALTRHDWRGFETLPKDSGYVVVANHVSHLDPFTFGLAFAEHGIVPRFLGKDTAFDLPVIGWMARHGEQIPVYRGTAGAAESLRAAVAAVNEDKAILIYPEGTITRDPDQWPMTGRTGAVRVALTTGKPLVPAVQWGPNEILAPYARTPRFFPRKTMRVHIGAPFDLSPWQGLELSDEVLTSATEALMDVITDMLAEIRGTRPVGPRIEVRTLEKAKTNYREPRND